MPENRKINVFVSYAHEDEEYREQLKKCLHERFCPDLQVWDDGRMKAGTEWDEEIKKHLNNAHIVLLLISRDFLLSDYIENIELKTALERHARKECRVIPIFARTCSLDPFPKISRLQGFPKDMRFLSDAGREIDNLYTQLQKEINEIAASMLTEQNIQTAKDQNDDMAERANAIEELRNKHKIFLSIPDTPEARKKRNELIFQADGKRNYEDWPYEIVPGIKAAQELDTMSSEDRQQAIAACINESVYSVHMVTGESDLKNGLGKLQYELAKGQHPETCKPVFRNILWLLSADLMHVIDKSFCQNPIFSGNDYGSFFDKIESLDADKDREILKRKKEFFPNKRVYLYYLFPTDHDNDLRIDLKTRIEEKNFSVRWNTPGEDMQQLKEDLEACEGAMIFYGSAGIEWFNVGQAKLLDFKNLRTRGVCLDEPEIDKKLRRDVSQREFITIRGRTDLDARLNDFLEPLQP